MFTQPNKKGSSLLNRSLQPRTEPKLIVALRPPLAYSNQDIPSSGASTQEACNSSSLGKQLEVRARLEFFVS